jgi:hypothetical protein
MSTENQQRLIIFLIGIATITAGVFTWRVGQIASTAAADDRASVSQTISQQEQEIEVSLAFVSDVNTYVRYAADYEEAKALDEVAADLEAQGFPEFGEANRRDADKLRVAASTQAAAAGIFGQQSLYSDLADPVPERRQFDPAVQLERLRAQASTGVTSPGVLDPDAAAGAADDIRNRMREMRWTVFVIILCLVLLTIAEVTKRVSTRIVTGVLGTGLFIWATVLAFGNFW